jgi:hypothetical protein
MTRTGIKGDLPERERPAQLCLVYALADINGIVYR